LWNDGRPELVILDGATGETVAHRSSPFDMKVRDPAMLRPGVERPSRAAPAAVLARFAGAGGPPSIVVKIDTSGTAPPLAAAFDAELEPIWEVRPGFDSIGHHVAVADLDGDGNDEVVFGGLAVDGKGRALYDRSYDNHVDMSEVFTAPDGGKRIVVSVCNEGPVHCLEPDGSPVWSKSKEDVPHGQAAWAGNFVPGRDGLEIVVLRSGHYGRFLTLDAETGDKVAEFEHRGGVVDQAGSRRYPDMPTVIDWHEAGKALWIPVDRRLADGLGRTIADLGTVDARVAESLNAGTSKQHLPVQAIAVDICGDTREEVVLYQPYQGKGIYVFVRHDSDCQEKFYVHRKSVYNRKSYF